jgi:hypothetical protein
MGVSRPTGGNAPNEDYKKNVSEANYIFALKKKLKKNLKKSFQQFFAVYYRK